MKADLHLHSTASDGTLEPGELVALAAELGFTHLALTDHDSVDAVSYTHLFNICQKWRNRVHFI